MTDFDKLTFKYSDLQLVYAILESKYKSMRQAVKEEVAKNIKLEAENAEMREFILGASHSDSCRRTYYYGTDCTCGLTALQEKLRKK